ncbi:MAG: PQQ-dependent sugar dehydrogenase [Actinomycetota bacterium]
MSRRGGCAALVLVLLTPAACADRSGTSRPGVVYHTAPEVSAAAGTGASFTGTVTFETVAAGLDAPVDIVWRPGDSTPYVVSQWGTVVPLKDGKAGGPVLDIRGLVANSTEQGLLGLAFHPTKPLAYVDYTNQHGDIVVAEYKVRGDGTFDPASARVVITVGHPHGNHNGGKVVFGPDGHMYLGMGDGGLYADPDRRALNPHELLGKLLRIDPEAKDGKPYTVPADNPFVGTDGARPEIWAVGLRNPWRFGFDGKTGDLWIADVGQDEIEEVDVGWASQGGGKGLSFGWSAFEGSKRFNSDQPAEGTTMPVFEYSHGRDGCAVAGGAVYRGSKIPTLQGWYLFGDYCSGIVRALHTVPGQATPDVVELGTQPTTSAVSAGPDGEVYAVDAGNGRITRLTAA